MNQPTLINLRPNEYGQKLLYYPFAVDLNRCSGSCNTLDNLSNKVCVPNETEDLNLNIFNMITGINESKTLTKHILCKCECKFDYKKCNLNQKWNSCNFWFDCKKHHTCEKDYILNPAACSCKNGKYLASITNDSVIMCDEIVEEQKQLQQILLRMVQLVEHKISIFYLPFY